DALKDCCKDVAMRFRADGGIFCLQRFKAKSKVSLMFLRESLFADDWALLAYSEEDLRDILNELVTAAIRYGLTMSIIINVLYQSIKRRDELKKISDENLQVEQTSASWVASFLRMQTLIKVTSRIYKASAVSGRLDHRLWSDHGIQLTTKVGIYRTVVPTTLPYTSSSAGWAGHLIRMEDNRIPNAISYGEVFSG
ncbi:unnamed protein product, partial [Pocillopora meandrina]